MAKGQKRGNKEAKKPKAPKKAPAVPVSQFSEAMSKKTPPRGG